MSEPISLPPAGKAVRHSASTGLVVGILVFIAVLGYAYYRYMQSHVFAEYAQVEGPLIRLQAPVAGRVLAVTVQEGALVQAGQLLVAMDDTLLRQNLLEARAALDVALQGGIPDPSLADAAHRAEQQSQAQQAKITRDAEDEARKWLEHWTAEHARSMVALRRPDLNNPAERATLSQNEMQVRTKMDQARQEFERISQERASSDAALDRLRRTQRNPGNPGPQTVALWQSRVGQAALAVEQAQATAPTEARVTWLPVSPNQEVQQGEILAVLSPTQSQQNPQNLWVSATFTKRDALRLHIGQACQIEIPENDTLTGNIANILTDSQGAVARINLNAPPPDTLAPSTPVKVTVNLN